MPDLSLSRQRILQKLPSGRYLTEKLTPGFLVLEGGAQREDLATQVLSLAAI